MWTEVKKPLPARHVKDVVESIEEVWEDSSGELSEESASLMRRDLFKLVGIVRGLMFALELTQPDLVADDVERIAVALRRVRLDEREACALIADRAPGNQEVGGENWTADYIARQIRARPTVI